MSINYSTIQVSKKAKEYAVSIINFEEIPDTHQLGFWLGIPIESDYIALAVYAEYCLQNGWVNTPNEIVDLLKKELPNGWYFL